MNHTHVLAFLVGAIAQALLTIWFVSWEMRYNRREIRRRMDAMEADAIFEEWRKNCEL